MAVKRKYRLNLRNYGNLPAIMLSQYDEGYALEFEIRDGTDAASDLSAYTVTLKGTRADTLAYSFSGTIATNVLTFVIDTTMTACAGRGTAEIAIKDTANDVLFATFNMPVFVERAAVPEGSIDADVERAQEIAEQVQEIVDNAAAAVSGAAEKWATGQINGTDVPSTDPAYENNAKYYAEQAETAAESIGIDATLTQADKAADAKKTGDEITALKEDLNDMPYSVYHADRVTDGVYLDANGEEQAQLGWSVTNYLIINNSAVYYIKTIVTSNAVKSCFYDENKLFISAFKTDTAGTNALTAPTNAKYVRFSVQTSEVNDFLYSSLLFTPYEESVIVPELVYGSSLAETFLDALTTGSYYDTTGGISDSASWSRTKLYPVKEGDSIYIENAFGVCAVFYDSNKSFVSYKDIYSHTNNAAFNVSTGVSYIGFNIRNANLSGYNCTVNGRPLGAKYSVAWLKESTNNSIWQNKTYISHGDSITWQDKREYGQGDHIGEIARGYQTIFSETVGLESYTNLGKSGWSMGIVNGNGIVNTIKGVANYGVYNLCTIACGTNDFKLNVPIGTLGVIGDTTFDDSTFYGAFRDSIEYILTSSPTIRIVLMTPLQRDNNGYDVNYTNSAGHKLIDYVNAVKAVGEMYGLPVCDMYANSGFTKKTLSAYTMDGLHPNDVGYQRMGGYLTGFLNTVGN